MAKASAAVALRVAALNYARAITDPVRESRDRAFAAIDRKLRQAAVRYARTQARRPG